MSWDVLYVLRHSEWNSNDNRSLQVLNSAADALVVPSRQEAFDQAASKAHACATPVIPFDTRGLPDIAVHHRTGHLAKAFDTLDLASGIARVLAQRSQHLLSAEARTRALERFVY